MSRSAVSGEHFAMAAHLLVVSLPSKPEALRAAVGARQQQVADGTGDAAVAVVEGMQGDKPQMGEPRLDERWIHRLRIDPFEKTTRLGLQAIHLALAGYAAASISCCDESLKRLHLVLLRIEGKTMRYSSQVKPISYLKANAAEVLTQLAEKREPLVITQNGEAKAVLQDVASYQETQETLALLKILALGNQDVEAGRVNAAADVVARLRAKPTTA